MYLRDIFILIFTPLARRCSGIHPNALTLVSLLAGILAGACFALTRDDPVFFLFAGLSAALSGAADSLDGIVARQFDRVSRFGDFLDHFCDRVVDIAILTGLAVSGRTQLTFGLIVTIIVLLNTYLGTKIESAFNTRIGGIGKAELFVMLIGFSMVMYAFPKAALTTPWIQLTLTDLLFILMALFTFGSMVHRFYTVYRICRKVKTPL